MTEAQEQEEDFGRKKGRKKAGEAENLEGEEGRGGGSGGRKAPRARATARRATAMVTRRLIARSMGGLAA